ncbi:NAD(P)-dependent alcohol dehydrogenase [Marinoscillum pacificum]|uniref:NAD(P)-dependent alcohol dehydrogenase n=1 Tax=Marinoscillum pacificum TaxID=392723 RepID=UPI0021589D9D|nr:NAD(P)-dependent alcohol dehydrogenase [Marinoscillum pacificum]
MKAVVYEKYGFPDILELKELPRPEPGSDQVLIKVLAASVNKADWHLLTGDPFPVRLMAGLTKPKNKVLGADVVGVVERIGSNVTQFKIGDEVYGDLSGTGFGAFAEYALTNENQLAQKPSNLTYEQTAALPMAAITALQGLRDKGKIREDDEVLINGASGGVGGFAIQVAKAFGAQVTAVCSTDKMCAASEQGADLVIDYKRVDFIKGDKQYDLVFDVIGNHGISDLSKILKPKGRYVTCAFSMSLALLGPWYKVRQGKQFINLMASNSSSDLKTIARLAEEGCITPRIQRVYTLDDVPEALQYMANGGMEGKLVVTI